MLSVRHLTLSCTLIGFTGCSTVRQVPKEVLPHEESQVPREFRAAWVATVANINWPSEPGLSTAEQKKEAVRLLNLLQRLNFNAVILQVRPQCDALYQSKLEPWSYYLTGEQGRTPNPFYDPLEFWIEQAHARGLELHAWVNPYRAHHVSGGEVTDASIVKKHPELVVPLESGYWWLDPSKRETQDHSGAVVMDIVRRYDIDGVHMDDYFYPYPSYNNNRDFPDDNSWDEYRREGGELSRGDWRRQGVNSFVQRLYGNIKREKRHVKFGVSPFGIWRPSYPQSIEGFDQYARLYADAKLWLNEGWIDYWTPQLYWPINQIPQSYPVLLGWWKNENHKGRHFWPGMSIGRLSGEAGVDEVLNQIMVTRGMLSENPGNVHWSIEPLVENPRLAAAITGGPYKHQALIPASPWLDAEPPAVPKARALLKGDNLVLAWNADRKEELGNWVVYYKYNADWDYRILARHERSFSIPVFKLTALASAQTDGLRAGESSFAKLTAVSVSAVDRAGNESVPVSVTVPALNAFSPPSDLTSKGPDASQRAEKQTQRPAFLKLGIEVLVEEHLDLLRGKRIGLVTNPSAVDSKLRSDVDILANIPGVNLVALFGAEHGVRGAKQGRILQEGEPDPATGIPVYSLYGDSYAPKQEWLRGIDMLLFDIQGVGSAWYTFKYSMSFAMEACAKAGIPFVVLDRPNPLGGTVVEGPYLNLGRIFRHPLPLRHGMTYGELAKMWNHTEGFGADVTVIKMKGWRRSMTWDETGLHWILPSPNMDTFETAVVYPGQCLFERSNLSEARGTTKPFLLTGAPWVDAAKASADLNSRGIPGALFRPAYFIPQKLSPGANTREKPWNRMCGGVEIMLTDYKAFRSVETALHIIDAYRKTNPDSLKWTPPLVLKKLEDSGMTVEQVVRASQEEVADFIKRRRAFLLYR